MVTSQMLCSVGHGNCFEIEKAEEVESKLGTRVDPNGEPIARGSPETVEEVRKMRYKLHPICKFCNLQSWNDRKNKKKGWCRVLSHILMLMFILPLLSAPL